MVPFTAADLAGWYLLDPAFLSSTLVGRGFTEEPGWRGFALPRLLEKFSVLVASLMHGAFNIFAAFFFRIQIGSAYGRLWRLYAGIWIVLAVVVAVRMGMTRARRPVARITAS